MAQTNSTNARRSATGFADRSLIACRHSATPGPPCCSYLWIDSRPVSWAKSSWCSRSTSGQDPLRSNRSEMSTRRPDTVRRPVLAAGRPIRPSQCVHTCSLTARWGSQSRSGSGLAMCVLGVPGCGSPQRSPSWTSTSLSWTPPKDTRTGDDGSLASGATGSRRTASAKSSSVSQSTVPLLGSRSPAGRIVIAPADSRPIAASSAQVSSGSAPQSRASTSRRLASGNNPSKNDRVGPGGSGSACRGSSRAMSTPSRSSHSEVYSNVT